MQTSCTAINRVEVMPVSSLDNGDNKTQKRWFLDPNFDGVISQKLCGAPSLSYQVHCKSKTALLPHKLTPDSYVMSPNLLEELSIHRKMRVSSNVITYAHHRLLACHVCCVTFSVQCVKCMNEWNYLDLASVQIPYIVSKVHRLDGDQSSINQIS